MAQIAPSGVNISPASPSPSSYINLNNNDFTIATMQARIEGVVDTVFGATEYFEYLNANNKVSSVAGGKNITWDVRKDIPQTQGAVTDRGEIVGWNDNPQQLGSAALDWSTQTWALSITKQEMLMNQAAFLDLLGDRMDAADEGMTQNFEEQLYLDGRTGYTSFSGRTITDAEAALNVTGLPAIFQIGHTTDTGNGKGVYAGIERNSGSDSKTATYWHPTVHAEDAVANDVIALTEQDIQAAVLSCRKGNRNRADLIVTDADGWLWLDSKFQENRRYNNTMQAIQGWDPTDGMWIEGCRVMLTSDDAFRTGLGQVATSNAGTASTVVAGTGFYILNHKYIRLETMAGGFPDPEGPIVLPDRTVKYYNYLFMLNLVCTNPRRQAVVYQITNT